jgi:quercetin dioxygenase-like cupin family protein
MVRSMNKLSLTAVGREHLDRARQSGSGRAAETVYGGHEHVLRQTVIALAAGAEMSEHENPGEATIYVLGGRVRLASAETSWDGLPGDLLIMPDGPHSLTADADSVLLLTVAKIP